MGAEPVVLAATDGVELEAEIDVPDGAGVVAVLCHPHPLYGGSMFDGVPGVLFRALPAGGIGALRFNFRGVGRSKGSHDEGRAERLDVVAAVARAAQARAGDRPRPAVVLAGWSFGADVSLTVVDDVVAGWCPIAPPLRVVPPPEMGAAADLRPKHLLVAQHDQFNPPDAARETVAGWSNTELTVVAGADHFMWGHGAFLADQVVAFSRSVT